MSKPAIRAVPVFGAEGWRKTNPELGVAYGSDASLRWEIAEHRAELTEAGAIGLIRGRMFAFEPLFSQTLAAIAQRKAKASFATRLSAAQAQADKVASAMGQSTPTRRKRRSSSRVP